MAVKCKDRPHCMWCEKPIAKWTFHYYMGVQKTNHTRYTSKAEVQKHHNEQITHVRYFQPRDMEGEPTEPRYIVAYSTWDGETYADDLFCGPKHAERFARAVARRLKAKQP